MRTSYLFAIRPTRDSAEDFPRAWWIPGAIGPLGVVQASGEGLKLIRPSLRGRALEVVLGSALGIAIIYGTFVPTAVLIIGALGSTPEAVVLWAVVAGTLAFGIMMPIYPHVRGLAAWRPIGPSARVQVLSAAFGMFRQELRISCNGQEAWVRTNARLASITRALRLANQMPSDVTASS